LEVDLRGIIVIKIIIIKEMTNQLLKRNRNL